MGRRHEIMGRLRKEYQKLQTKGETVKDMRLPD